MCLGMTSSIWNKYLKSILNGIMSLSMFFYWHRELKCKYPFVLMMFLKVKLYIIQNCSAVTLWRQTFLLSDFIHNTQFGTMCVHFLKWWGINLRTLFNNFDLSAKYRESTLLSVKSKFFIHLKIKCQFIEF